MIDNAIKNAKNSQNTEALFEVRAPGRAAIIVEVIGNNEGHCETKLASILKKNGGVIEKNLLNMFERKGVIVLKNDNETSLDQVEDDAIEFGAEDVEEEPKCFTLTCSPLEFPDVLEKFKEKYEILYSQIDYVPNMYVEMPNIRDKAFLKALLVALENSEHVTGVYHNASF